MKRFIKVAAVSPEPFDREQEYRNVAQAVDYVSEAARHGSQLVCFPEGYPGPCFGPMDSGAHLDRPPLESICESARRHGVFISCGNLENADIPGTYHLTHKLISPRGEILANYRRCQPTTPVLNRALYGKLHVVPGDELKVVDTELGKIGLLICSELYVPELARIEMLMGAEILLAPIGGIHTKPAKPVQEADFSTEHCVARARAAENLVYVITTINVFSVERRRGSFVAAPEGTLAFSPDPGIVYADLDMDHLWRLRSRYIEESDMNPEGSGYRPQSIKYGIIHERRPELYRKLVEPDPQAYDYFYFKRGPDAWKEEYEKVRNFGRKSSDA